MAPTTRSNARQITPDRDTKRREHDFTKLMMPGILLKAYDRFIAPKSFMKP
jgi:hypothetical protein